MNANAQTAQNARPQPQRDANGRQLLTAQRVSQILAACIIPAMGPNKLNVVGRGNPFNREDGTQVRIFNVAAFGTVEDKDRAKASFLEGHKLETAGDLTGAQAHYKNALNQMLSFNVTEQNAYAYNGVYQVSCIVAMGDKRDGSGQRVVLNQPKPVAVETTGQSVAADFAIPTVAQPATTDAFEVKQKASLTADEITSLNNGPDDAIS